MGLDSLCRVSRLVRSVGHGALAACWAVCRCRAALEVGNGRRVLVDGAAGLLWRHAGLGLLRVHVGFVGSLGDRRGGVGLLLWVLHIRVLGVLLHGDYGDVSEASRGRRLAEMLRAERR